MHHLIDGYNLLFALGRLSPRSGRDALEGARRWLLQQLKPVATPPTHITVVFDSRGNTIAPTQEMASGVTFLFPRGESADDHMETLIENAPNAKDILVVSNDHRVRLAARHGHCHYLNCLDYFEHFVMNPTVKDPTPEPTGKADPEGDDMTAEEIRHWLDIFGQQDKRDK